MKVGIQFLELKQGQKIKLLKPARPFFRHFVDKVKQTPIGCLKIGIKLQSENAR